MSEWILCEDELPQINDVYQVTWWPRCNPFNKNYIGIVEFDDGKWIGDIPQAKHYGDGRYDILAWMPLPDAYVEDEK